MAEKQLPLAGIRVVDFTHYAAGPLTSKFLSDYGAEVFLVESEVQIATGGGSRQTGAPGKSPIETAWFHNKMNPGKLSITVDMTQPQGREVIKRLLCISDVLVANLRPRVLEQWGLTYEVVRELRPEIIYLTMPTMGEGGPRSFYGGLSWGIQAMAGLNLISGYADRPPVSPTPYSHPDVSCNPLHAIVAILAALRHRRRTGRGQLIELSQYESAISWTGPHILQYSANGTIMGQTENRHPNAVPHDVYRCRGADAWCAISIFSDAQWRSLCEALDRPELADDPAYASLSARKAHEGQLRDLIEPWTGERAAEHVMQRLQGAGVPCSVVNDFPGLLHHDLQLQARGHWTEVDHPELETTLVEGWGVSLSRVPPATARRAPLLGEHNDYVFQDVMGMSEDEVNMYLVEGVLR